MYYQSLNIASPPPGGSGGGLLEAGEKKINLDLRIGRCACASEGGLKRISIIQEEREYLFSRAQFDELRNQISIHNSIAYGFPVAFHLLLPIWMSVLNYLGPAIYHAYPSLRDLSRVKGDCSSSVMDSEPGRCRRTDGRKWRCSKNVVPFQKYCERHMHRGRQGSRKHVEARPDNRAWDNSRMPVMSLVASDHDTDSRVSVSIQSDLGPSQPRSSYTTGFPTVLKCRNDETRDASLRANCSMSGGDHADGKYSFDGKPMKLSSRNHNTVGNNYMGFNSPRYGLSPKSVLNAAGKVGLGLGCTATMEAGSQRCRRTDGKKWQCRRDALHNQKYCNAHMHRGAKRIVVRPEYSRRFQAAPTTITGNLDSGINLNMVPASPQHGGPSNNSSSSPSDATTITDENISFCLTNSLHHG